MAVVAVSCVSVASVLAGCSSSASVRSVPVSKALTVDVPADSSSFQPTGASVPGADTSVLSDVTLPDSGGIAPSPYVALVTPMHLKLSGSFPQAGVVLKFRVDPSLLPPGMTPFVATQTAPGVWTPVISSYDARSGIVQAHAAHFSIWGVFAFSGAAIKTIAKDIWDSTFGAIKVTDPAPTCGDSSGLQADIAPNSGLFQFCPQDGSAGDATLKLNSTLAFPADVTIPPGATASITPPNDLFTQIAGFITKAYSTKIGHPPPNLNVIAAGSEADVSFPLATGATARVTTGIDVEAYLTGIIDVAISELTVMADHLGAKTKTNLNAISDAKCVDEISQVGSIGAALTTANLKDLTKVAVDCAGQVVDLGALGALQGALAVAAELVAAVFETAFLGASIVVGGLSGPSAVITTTKPALSYSCDTRALLEAASAFGKSIGRGTPSYLDGVACVGQYAAAAFGAVQPPNPDGNVGELVFASQGGSWKAACAEPSCDGASTIGMPVSIESQLLSSLATGPGLNPTIPIPVDTSLAFSTAKTFWEQDVCSSASTQSSFDWPALAVDLNFAAANGIGDSTGFTRAADELNDLASIPETDVTPAQMNQAQSDIQNLNTFFGTPGDYISATSTTCPGL